MLHTSTPRRHSAVDDWINAVDNALRTLSGAYVAARPTPATTASPEPLTRSEVRLSASLMRVNHVGEICAQALYNSQLIATRDAGLRENFRQAAKEENDHLAWTHQRLRELEAKPSVLNPFWYAGAFGIGLLAGRIGDGTSLGFVAETEAQVEEHLASHLDLLPSGDTASRAIVSQMTIDEAKHGVHAREAGAVALPRPVRWAMRAAAKLMTTTARYI